ncbi:hypothetical protein Q3V37_18800 [Micromonospora profundi]|uniref:LysM domain-containing protein n=1 Tax=Micromonospora profundi TaxID=1420889 RepID=A0AAJ6HNT9_9ACTN|nr:hypothetical protein [Micromonospora profundi]WLS43452.1 hypothetical protein Q3V37_18800 [Micromonospora profundi]
MVLIRRAVAAALVLVGLVVGAPAGQARAAPAETGRYYVVGPAVDGQKEYLYAIALRTLGNGNRYREIVELNVGRKQPDGATFTDGLVLEPGWMLVLPADAKGQGVRIGRMPTIAARSPRPSPSTLTPSAVPSRPAPRSVAPSTPAPSTAAPSTAAPPPPSAPAVAATDTETIARPWDEREVTTDPVNPLLVRGGAGVLAVIFAVVALMLLRRAGSRRGALALTDDGPWPPQRHHTPTPAELAIDSGNGHTPPPGAQQSSTTAPSTAAPSSAASRPSAGAPPSPVAQPSSSAVSASTEQGRSETTVPVITTPTPSAPPTPIQSGTRPGETPVSPTTSEPATNAEHQVPGPVAAVSSSEQEPTQALMPEVPRPTVPGGDDVPYLSADLDSEAGPMRVRLAGVATGRGAAPAYAWLGEREPAPPAILPLVLGHKGPWRLHVDLGRAPDVLTLVGPVGACRRAAVLLARRLHAAGIGVAVVGAALGTQAPGGSRVLDALPQPPTPEEELPKPYVVFTAGLAAGDAAGARSLATTTGGRCVPVVIGPVPGGRWSIQVGSDAEVVAPD